MENYSLTLNGASTFSTSGNSLVDMFFRLGASRKLSAEEIISDFSKAFDEDPLIAMKLLFYARDIRGGQGERRYFRICLKHLLEMYPNIAIANIPNIVNLGRWDDLWAFLDYAGTYQAALNAIRDGIDRNDALLFKWLPREKSAKRQLALLIAKGLGMSMKDYRKMLAEKTSVVEQFMCSNRWSKINYASVPSRAMHIYQNAFQRHNPNGWSSYLEALDNGSTKVNSRTLYPHEVIASFNKSYDTSLAEHQWAALPDFINGKKTILPVCDVSGSMRGLPMDVSVGLGLYLAERNSGDFKNQVITFSEKPTLLTIDHNWPLHYRISLLRSNAGYNTNIQAVFDLILSNAKNNQTPQNEMPEMILIISDMEFDEAINYDPSVKRKITSFEAIKQLYQKAGYELPKVVFWNVSSVDTTNIPTRLHETGTALVSGFSPSVMKSILNTQDFTPFEIMMATAMNPRYRNVTI